MNDIMKQCRTELDFASMERWSGRVALVTGTSSGIGAAAAEGLVKQGLKVVGIARRIENVEELANNLQGERGKLYPLKADISKEKDVLSVFEWIRKNLGGVDVLINNAASANYGLLKDITPDNIRSTFDVNVIGLSVCTREAIKSMRERGVDDGHIININSIVGHMVVSIPGMYAYSASKHSVTALTEALRRELVQQKSKLRVTSVSPGSVDTEALRNLGVSPDTTPMLQTKDIVDAIFYVLSTPAHAQVHELIIRPVGENF